MEAIDPNAMTFVETKQMVADGRLQMVVDTGLAVAAVRHGVPLTPAGKAANLLMIALPVVGLVLAILWAWWWLPLGLAASIGNFRVAQAECVRAVRAEALKSEHAFDMFRRHKAIRFEITRV